MGVSTSDALLGPIENPPVKDAHPIHLAQWDSANSSPSEATRGTAFFRDVHMGVSMAMGDPQ